MIETYRQVIQEKKDQLESLEFKMREYRKWERLSKTRVDEISSLLKDVVEVLVRVLDEELLGSGRRAPDKIPEGTLIPS